MCHSLMLYYLEFISKHHRSKISSGLYIYVSWITVHWKGRKLLFALLQLLLYLASKSQFLCNLEKKNNPSDSIHCLLKYIHVWFMMDASDETIRLSVSTAEKYLLTFSFILNLYRDFDPVHWLVSCFSFFFFPPEVEIGGEEAKTEEKNGVKYHLGLLKNMQIFLEIWKSYERKVLYLEFR